jgi:hypothetical protein
MFCQKCGAENKDGAAFCNSCGAALVPIPVQSTTESKPQNDLTAPKIQPQEARVEPVSEPVPAQDPGKRRKAVLWGVVIGGIVVVLIIGAVFVWNNQDWNKYCTDKYPGTTYNTSTNTCEKTIVLPTSTPTSIGPHANPIFHAGDIVSPDNENEGGGILIKSYDPVTDTYLVNWVAESLDRTWYHGTDPAIFGPDDSWSRTKVETEDPYKIGTADPNNLPSAPSSAPLVLTGGGSDLQKFDTWQSGGYIFTSTYSGDGNFVVWIKDSNGNMVGLAANTIDSSTGSKMVHLDADTYYAEVTANGPWTITITPP